MFFSGYCNSWEHAGSSLGPGVNPLGKHLPKTSTGKYLWENFSRGVPPGSTSHGNYLRKVPLPGSTSRKTSPGNYLYKNLSRKVPPGKPGPASTRRGADVVSRQERLLPSKVVPGEGRSQESKQACPFRTSDVRDYPILVPDLPLLPSTSPTDLPSHISGSA